MLNGRPFKDATSQNAHKHCSNVEDSRKFVTFFPSFVFEDFEIFQGCIDGSSTSQNPHNPLCSHAVWGIKKLCMESNTHCFIQVKLFECFRKYFGDLLLFIDSSCECKKWSLKTCATFFKPFHNVMIGCILHGMICFNMYVAGVWTNFCCQWQFQQWKYNNIYHWSSIKKLLH